MSTVHGGFFDSTALQYAPYFAEPPTLKSKMIAPRAPPSRMLHAVAGQRCSEDKGRNEKQPDRARWWHVELAALGLAMAAGPLAADIGPQGCLLPFQCSRFEHGQLV